jgi:hypothetical protein
MPIDAAMMGLKSLRHGRQRAVGYCDFFLSAGNWSDVPQGGKLVSAIVIRAMKVDDVRSDL